MHHDMPTEMVCSQLISFDLEGNVVHNVSFVGGCNGNLKAVSKLVEGMTVEQIEGYLKGNLCGRRPRPARTSWPGPFARPMNRKRREHKS